MIRNRGPFRSGINAASGGISAGGPVYSGGKNVSSGELVAAIQQSAQSVTESPFSARQPAQQQMPEGVGPAQCMLDIPIIFVNFAPPAGIQTLRDMMENM